MQISDPISKHTGDAADVLPFEVKLEYRNTIPTALAYNLSLNYTFPSTLVFNTSSVFACIYGGGTFSSYSNAACLAAHGTLPVIYIETDTVQFFFDVLPSSQIFFARMEAVIIQDVQPEQQLVNLIQYSFDSSPLADPFSGRQYFYNSTQTTTVIAPNISIAVIEVSDANVPLPKMTIQETFWFILNITMPEVQTDTYMRVVIPPNFYLLGANITYIGQNIVNSSVYVNQPLNQNSSFAFDIATGILSINYGLITNIADNVVNASDFLQVHWSEQ